MNAKRSRRLPFVLVLFCASAVSVHAQVKASELDGPLPVNAERHATASGAGLVNDLKRKVEEALAEKNPGKRLQRLSDFASGLSIREIPEVLTLAGNLKPLREKAVLQGAAFKRWSELAPAEAFASIAKLPESRLKVEVVRIGAAKFARHDLEKAAIAATDMKAGRSRNEALEMVAGVWAESDPKRALQWAENLPNGFAKESALNLIRFAWSHRDPVAAAPQVEKLPAGDTRNSLITNIAGEWAAIDPKAAIRWAMKLTDAAEKELALANVAESWADRDPATASAFAAQLSPITTQQRASIAVASRWATQDPEAAISWALQTADSEVQKRSLEEVLNLWASINPEEAGRWIDGLKPGPNRELAIRNYVSAVLVWAPESGVRRALLLTDETARQELSDQSVRRWLELDRDAVTNWLKTAKVSQEMKARWMGWAEH